MPDARRNAILAASIIFAVFLWGGNNAGTKFVVSAWPPIWTGSSRFLCAGLLLLAFLRMFPSFGACSRLTPEITRRLWWRGGLSLAVYIVVFNWAVKLTAVSHVALYLGASPIWALLWERHLDKASHGLGRYVAAGLALAGVVVLFWPSLNTTGTHWIGETLGLAASVLWTNFGRQCRALGSDLSGAEVTAHTMWRSGILLLPLAGVETWHTRLAWRLDLALVHAYCIIAGGVVAFGLWTNALRHWPASRVLLFNNLIPLSTMLWAWAFLKEPVTSTFWVAMGLVAGGVLLGQVAWKGFLPARPVPPE